MVEATKVVVRSHRELDKLVAEHVMTHPGESRWYASDDGGKSSMISFDWYPDACDWMERNKHEQHNRGVELIKEQVYPHYSTAIADAWQVAEKLKLALVPQSDYSGVCWLAMDLDRVRYTGDVVLVEKEDSSYSHKFAPVAICMAALRTHGIEVTLELDNG